MGTAFAPSQTVSAQQLGLWSVGEPETPETLARWWCRFCASICSVEFPAGRGPGWPPWTPPERAFDRLPRLPLRHWILTLPDPWRAGLAADKPQLAKVRALFVQEIFALLDSSCGTELGASRAHSGAMVVVHRCGTDLEPNVHFHALVLDGAYADAHDTSERPVFRRPRDALSTRQLERAAERIAQRLQGMPQPSQPCLPARPFGPGPGRSGPPAPHTTSPGSTPPGWQTCRQQGVRIRVGCEIAADERGTALRLARYVTQPPFAADTFERLDGEQAPARVHAVRQHLRRPLPDGRSHLDWTMQALAPRLRLACPPRGRVELTYHGVLASASVLHRRLGAQQLPLLDPGPLQRVTPKRARARAAGRIPMRAPGQTILCTRCGLPMEPSDPGHTVCAGEGDAGTMGKVVAADAAPRGV